MGKIEKGVRCSVRLCEKNAVRSLSTEKVKSSGLGVEDVKRTYLCEEHYKEYKKRSKSDRQVERWRWNA